MKIDEDSSGSIMVDDLVHALQYTDVSVTLESLGIDATNAVRLFETINVSGAPELEIDDIVMVCVAFTVPAKSVDMEFSEGQNMKI